MATKNIDTAAKFQSWTARGVKVVGEVGNANEAATTKLKEFSAELATFMTFAKASTDKVQAAITLMVVQSLPDAMRAAYTAKKADVKNMTAAEKQQRARGTARVAIYPARIMGYAYGNLTKYQSDMLDLVEALEKASGILTKDADDADGTVPVKPAAALQTAIVAFCEVKECKASYESETAAKKAFKPKPEKTK